MKSRASLWDRLTNNVLSKTEALVLVTIFVGLGIVVGKYLL